MSTEKYPLDEQEIPEGFQIFVDRLEVVGVRFRKNDAAAFAAAKDGWLELERDPKNQYNLNVIKVIGCNKDSHGTKRRFIGYVPKDVSWAIIEGGYWGQVQPRLLKIFVGSRGFVEILFQVLGPEDKKSKFRQTSAPKGSRYNHSIEHVEQLIIEEKYDDAIKSLLALIDETENDAKKTGKRVVPLYYEKLAIIYRKQKRYGDEVEILDKYHLKPKSLGSFPKKLARRLIKAKQLRDKNST